MQFRVAGVSFKADNIKLVLGRATEKRVMCRLEAEPDNKVDRNAVAVMAQGGIPIGYVPRHVVARYDDLDDKWGYLELGKWSRGVYGKVTLLR